jgi:hypothetical protein
MQWSLSKLRMLPNISHSQVIMSMRGSYIAYSLLTFLEQESELAQQVCAVGRAGAFSVATDLGASLGSLVRHLPGLVALDPSLASMVGDISGSSI